MPAQRRIFISAFISLFIAWGQAQEITVRPGDTLWDLARRHDTSVDAIRQANNLVGDALQPGMTLSLPGGSIASPTSYTVQTGDTLHEISVAFQIAVDDLIAYNDLDGTLIRPGQVLSLTPPDTPLPGLQVTVAPGDTLWGIARANDVTVEALLAANGLAATSVLRPGEVLNVPGRYAGTHPDQGGAAAPEVTVAPGESLWQIARRYDTTVAALMAANELSGTNIRAGDTLRVLPGSQLVRAAPEPAPVPSPQAGLMVWPLSGQITSRFGYRRLRIGGTNMHYGLDIDGNTGDPIVAAVGGEVVYSGWQGGYGNLVVIEAGNHQYYYAHADSLLVQVGQHVEAGQKIATVGTTGRVTGSHLHFEIRVDGSPIDPLPLLQTQAQN